MSKIREALRLWGGKSTSERPSTAVAHSSTPVDTAALESGQGFAKTRSRINHRHRPVFTYVGEESVEPTPGISVKLNLKALENAGLVPAEEDQDIVEQQFRRIKRPLLQSAFELNLPTGKNANVIMMASAMPGAGKTFCAFNLAQSISLERDVGVVLVDADVLKPGLSEDLGLQQKIGLTEYLANRSLELQHILIQSDLNNMVVIPSGGLHPQATELLASRRMKHLVDQLSDRFPNRVIIFDAPPLLLTSEAQVLAKIVGQIVLVIEARVSSQESIIRALEMLDRNKAINAILNKSRGASGRDYDGGMYGYYSYSNRGKYDA